MVRRLVQQLDYFPSMVDEFDNALGTACAHHCSLGVVDLDLDMCNSSRCVAVFSHPIKLSAIKSLVLKEIASLSK